MFDECDVKFALEVHPTEIAFDYYSTAKLLEVFDRRPTLGLNFDPSHLVWQGVNPCVFLRDFADRVYHVHMKDVKVTLDGRAGILGSHIEFGDTRRGWNFVSLGHGNVDFDGIIRELNQMAITAPCPWNGRIAAWSGPQAPPKPTNLPAASISSPRTWPLIPR